MAPVETSVKRAVAFVDVQNLYHAAREAFGYTYPNYDVSALLRRSRPHARFLVKQAAAGIAPERAGG